MVGLPKTSAWVLVGPPLLPRVLSRMRSRPVGVVPSEVAVRSVAPGVKPKRLGVGETAVAEEGEIAGYWSSPSHRRSPPPRRRDCPRRGCGLSARVPPSEVDKPPPTPALLPETVLLVRVMVPPIRPVGHAAADARRAIARDGAVGEGHAAGVAAAGAAEHAAAAIARAIARDGAVGEGRGAAVVDTRRRRWRPHYYPRRCCW